MQSAFLIRFVVLHAIIPFCCSCYFDSKFDFNFRFVYFLGENFGFWGPLVKDRSSNPLPGAWSVAVSRSDLRKMIIRMSVCR